MLIRRIKCVLLLGVFVAAPALAELGGSAVAIPGERAVLRASGSHVQLARFARHDLVLPNGGAVHEFANAAGQIFAVSWQGPGKPDLRKLLGVHFAALQAENLRRSRVPRLRRQPMTLASSDLTITSGGHMGWFWGVAMLPALTPAGVTAADLQPG